MEQTGVDIVMGGGWCNGAAFPGIQDCGPPRDGGWVRLPDAREAPPPRHYVHRLPYLELLRQVNLDLSAQCSEFVLCRHSPSRERRSGSCPLYQIWKSGMAFPLQCAVHDWGGWGPRLRLCPRYPGGGPWLRPCPPSHPFRNRCLGVCPRYRVIVGSGVLCIRIP